MVHPLKAASSFECDGCNHHASFHKMENHVDDEFLSRLRSAELARAQEVSKSDDEEVIEVGALPSKRRRLAIADGEYLESGLHMPEKARSTLLGSGQGRKRGKAYRTDTV